MTLGEVALAVLLVAAGGAAGAVVRHVVVATASTRGPAARAAAVATCNVIGAVVLAAVVGIGGADRRWLGVVVGAGFCGALTTFSTWVVDAAATLQAGARPAAAIVALDLLGQLVVGVGLAWLVLNLT